MVKQEDPELTSFHRHTKITIYRTTTYENDLKISRKDFPRLKVYKRNHNEVGKSDKDVILLRGLPQIGDL